MANYLPTVEKNLRSAARRYENVKYSLGLAILFLMKGTSAFSDDNKIQEAERKKDVLTNDQTKKSVVKETKAVTQANKKLKASWATMQFGANDMYSNFFATPKTKVEKTSVVKNEKTVLVASADNSVSLPMFAKLLSDIEETTENRTEVLATIANKEETPTMEEIKASKQELRSSVGNLQDKIDIARRENQKEIDGLRLELIQLMEQGNQVVKSPWSSWQFGANYMYDNWNGAYKGRGDKAEKYPFEGIYTRSSDLFLRNISPLDDVDRDIYEKYTKSVKDNAINSALTSTLVQRGKSVSYGLASNSEAQEPIAKIELGASVKPKNISEPQIKVELPKIEPKVIKELKTPQPLGAPTPPTINIPKFNPVAPKVDPVSLPTPPTFNIKLGSYCNGMETNCTVALHGGAYNAYYQGFAKDRTHLLPIS